MAIVKTLIWGNVNRPWGHEVRVDFTDDAGTIHHESMVFPSAPSQSDLDGKVAELKTRIEAQAAIEIAVYLEPTKEFLIARVLELELKETILNAEKLELILTVDRITAEKAELISAPVERI